MSQGKIKSHRYAPHEINNADKITFDVSDYSKFKYGDYEISKRYGTELFDYFYNNILGNIKTKRIIVYSSPYAFIPTASYHMTDSFYSLLQENIGKLNRVKEIEFGKINRMQTYIADYGSMNAKERYDLIKNDTYELLKLPNENATLLFLDDISITGTHQIVIEGILKELGIMNDSIFLYYAKLNDQNIPATIENILNYSFVKSYKELLKVVLAPQFRNTTRTTKFLLGLPVVEFEAFIRHLNFKNKMEILLDFYNGAIKNGYDSIPEFKCNLDRMQLSCDLLEQN
jgi:hypothetical protein|tara:strand:- start:815 stop:1672 length:858 start_codon:yes stop_codon:yes gene_type:complete